MSVGLTYEDVEHHVTHLPKIVREHLALGPIEPQELADVDGEVTEEVAKALLEPCRVCDALGEGGRNLPKASHQRDRLHAHELWAWHDVSAVDLIELADQAGLSDEALEEDSTPSLLMREVLGALSYARCCAIYSAANASLRRLPN